MSLFSVSFLLVPYVSLLLCPFVEGALLNKKEYLQDAVDGLSVSVPGDSSPLSSSPAELPASVASFPPPPESNSWAVVVSSSPPPPPPPRLSDPWAIATSSTPPPPLSSDGAILPSEPSPTSPELRPSVDVGEPSGPTAVVQSPASLITPPPTVPGTLSTALSSDQAGCIPWPQCNIFFQHVGVYYHPQEGANTDCVANGGAQEQAIPPNMVPPAAESGYVVFTSIEARDGCKVIGNTFSYHTSTFGPGQLSSIRDDGQTYSFNLADLPCPPESVNWNRGLPYTPQIAHPSFLTEMDPAWASCIAGHSQGIDPFFAFPANNGGQGRHDGPGGFRRHRRGPHGHPRTVPLAAAATTTTMGGS